MRRSIAKLFGVVLIAAPANTLAAEDAKDAKPILEKAVKALGGEEALKKASIATWKSKSTFYFQGNANEFNGQVTVKGIDHSRNEFEGMFGDNAFKGIVVIAGDKAWRKFNDNLMEVDEDGLANERRNLYLQVIPTRILPLMEKGFKVAVGGEEKVDDKPAVVLNITGPDEKEFKLFLDKESGLPVKQVASVIGFGGEEYEQETTFASYKEFDGVKRATKVEGKRNGEKFFETEISDFKVLKEVEEKTFAEPE